MQIRWLSTMARPLLCRVKLCLKFTHMRTSLKKKNLNLFVFCQKYLLLIVFYLFFFLKQFKTFLTFPHILKLFFLKNQLSLILTHFPTLFAFLGSFYFFHFFKIVFGTSFSLHLFFLKKLFKFFYLCLLSCFLLTFAHLEFYFYLLLISFHIPYYIRYFTLLLFTFSEFSLFLQFLLFLQFFQFCQFNSFHWFHFICTLTSLCFFNLFLLFSSSTFLLL